MSTTPFDVTTLREQEFPQFADGEVVYLNNASTGPLPASTVATLDAWARHRTKPWTVSDQDDLFPALAHVREQCAKLIGASAAEIALTPNTSFGLSLAANALPIGRDEVVVVAGGEFPSIVYAWQAAAQTKGFRIDTVLTSDQLIDEDALLLALELPGVRALVISWVSFATGQRMDLARLGDACRERDIYFVVDAMQGVGCAALDVAQCHVDIVCVGGHKWLLSPWGTGFMYVREELIASMQPPIVGWFVGPASENYGQLLNYDLTYFSSARRFEVMTLAAQDLIAMGSSLDLLLSVGAETVESYVSELTKRLVDGLADTPTISVVTPTQPKQCAGIVTITSPDTTRLSSQFSRAGVVHSLRENRIRLSPHFYNTIDEIDKTVKLLKAGILS